MSNQARLEPLRRRGTLAQRRKREAKRIVRSQRRMKKRKSPTFGRKKKPVKESMP